MTYEHVKKIVNAWDPIDLLSAHCPPDEYSVECKKIVESLTATASAQEIGLIIYSIFTESFGSDVFIKSINECIDVAQKLLK